MVEYAPAAIRGCFDTVHQSIPGAVLSGIVGDSAHTYGYHRGRDFVSASDYSVQRPDDKQGDGQAASALDISLNPADMRTVTQRLIDASLAGDGRVYWPLREFFGTTNGTTVTGLDVRDRRWVTSDSSHLWHVHLSFYRKYANDHAACQGVASVIVGGGAPSPPPADQLPMEMDEMLLQRQSDKLGVYIGGGKAVWVRNGGDYTNMKNGGVPSALVTDAFFSNVIAAMGGAKG